MKGNTLKIDVMDYMSEERLAEIAEEEVRLALRHKLYGRNECEDFISNLAYDTIFEEIAEIMGENSDEVRNQMAATISKILGEESSIRFEIFRKDYKRCKAFDIINEILEEKRSDIEQRVMDAVDLYIKTDVMRELQDDIAFAVEKAIWNKFIGEDDES